MKLFDLIKNIDILETDLDLKNQKSNLEICNITINSADVKIKSMFICLVGTKTDGHKYIGEAVINGAVLIVLEYKPKDFDLYKGAVPYIIVENTREAEAKMWSEWYGNPAENIKIIGITGTNGKTSVSYMIKQILDDAGYRTALFGTIKYIIGDVEKESKLTTSDPEELARLFSLARDAGIDYAVMEVSSHSLELDKTAGLEIFDIGIFTNLTQDHLDFHITMENYKRAKAKLFKKCKIGILNADDNASEDIVSVSTSKNYLYAKSKKKADSVNFAAKNIKYLGVDGIEYDFCYFDKYLKCERIFRISSPMAGEFYVDNTLAAAACGIILGIDGKIISGALKKVRIRGRMEKLDTDTPYSVFIDYAHTPDALENVLKSMRTFVKGRIITLFGCGGDRDKSKRPIMGQIAYENSDFCIVTSDNSRTENPENIIKAIVEGIDGRDKYKIIVDRREAIEYAMDIAQPDDIILLAGKGHEEYINEKGTVRHFSESETVFEILQKQTKNYDLE
ncbi:MAG: UDP-N-acetylmuramoyl-L-alanyl-D-glutamate--2,6-diaminopimelate ligase [Oscillospiraceae bacterium]|nr:UDP-N-acetylmuramoyl-L-alanyl-D-glutamate--2,6-diaminopimelate ligase [Oscillospiraceae bacterium]